MSFKPYPKYKESGVEWLGRVPEHWEAGSIKHLITFTTGWTPPTGDDDSYGGPHLWANISDLGPRVLTETAKSLSDHAVQVGRISKSPKGSLLFSFKLSIGQVSFAGVDMYTNEAIATFGPSDHVDLDYAYYMFPIALVMNSTENIYGAKLLNQQLIRNACVLVPPRPEQSLIATFLSHETAKIDALIAEQQRLIELLQEKRQAVISHAVTKGLNPDAPMKDSGIEWLGKVPDSWAISKPKHLTTKIVDGVHFKPDYVSDGVPFVTVQNLTAGNGLSFDNLNYITQEAHEEYFRRANPEKGDVLLTKDGATLGVARVVDTDRVFSIFVSVALLKPIRDRLDPWFLRYAMESSVVFQQFKSGEQGSALKHIHLVDLRNVRLLLPPIEEQRAIVAALDKELARLGALVEESHGAITLLQERRSALISAAVTGQIDVRGFAGGSEAA